MTTFGKDERSQIDGVSFHLKKTKKRRGNKTRVNTKMELMKIRPEIIEIIKRTKKISKTET